MKSIRRRAPLVAAAIALAFAAPAALAAGHKPQTRFDQFIVRFKDNSAEKGNAALRQRLLDDAGRGQGLHVGQLRRLAVGADVVRTDRPLDAQATKAFIGRLRADPRVEYAEVDARVYPALTPNDPNYGIQWHYFDPVAGINLPAAWDSSTGTGQVVAVIDTGVVDHIDLSPNLLAGGYDFVSDVPTANDGDGRDNDPSDPGDWVAADECDAGSAASNSSWHGTHVSGTIAAATNNVLGVAGVAFGAKVLPVRVLGKCGGISSDISDAIVWASGGAVAGVPTNIHPAKVINLSLGGPGACLASTQNAINAAVANGATVVIAAGNDNSDASGFQPASCTNIITVAALGRTGARASYSNYGAVVDIAAPGGDGGDPVWSTLNDGTTVPGADIYAGYQGTSMATPHVAGVAALAQAKAGGTINPNGMKTLLEQTSRALPVACPQGCGVGLLDAANAVAAAGTPMLLVSDATNAAEGNAGTHTATFDVKLSKAVGVPVSFNIATANGSATAGSDYVALSATGQVIPAGQLSKSFAVTVNGDAVNEADETFVVNVTSVAGIAVLDAQGTHAILNDDPAILANGVPVPNLAGATDSQKTFQMDVPAGATNLSFVTGGGTGDADLYVRLGTEPTLATYDCRGFNTGNSENCSFPTPSAGRYYVMVNAYEAYSGLTLTGAYTAPVPTTNLSINDMSLNEGDSGSKLLTFTASLSQATNVPVTFNFTTVDGTAVGGPDFGSQVMVPQTIAAGQTSKTFSITIPGDTAVEPTEYFYVNLSNVVGANLTDGQGIGYIINNDGALISINDVAVGEGNAGTKVMTFTVSLSQAAPGPVTYNINTQGGDATAGNDYVTLNLTGQTIPAGQTSKTHAVTINGDATIEPTEVFLVYVRQPTGASVWDGQGTGYILNDDGPTLSVPDASVGEGNSGSKMMNVTVQLSQASANPVTFGIATSNVSATAGSDYTALNLTGQTIPAGQTSKVFQIPVAGDTTVEPNETFLVTLAANPVGATLYDRQAIATIYNDDGPTLSVNDVSISEGNAGTKVMTFTVSLSQTAAAPVTYNIATSNLMAAAGSDYVARSLVGETIPAGQLSKTFAVTINGDTAVESNETFRVTLSNISSNATLFKFTGTGTITNDD